MLGAVKAVIGGEAVVNHPAGVVRGNEPPGGVKAALGTDQIDRGVGGHQPEHPSAQPADPPAGFVGHQPRGRRHGGDDVLEERLGPAGGPQDGLAGGRRGEIDAVRRAEVIGDLAEAVGPVLVELDDGRLGLGPQLAGQTAKI